MKDKIINTSICLFNKYGIKAVTMNDIAANMKISKRTLYAHFTSREELLFECVNYKFNAVGIFSKQDKLSLLDILCDAYAHLSTFYSSTNIICLRDIEKHYPAVYAFIIEHVIGYTAVLQTKITAAIERDEIRHNVNPKMIEHFLRGYFIRLFTVNEHDALTIPYPDFYSDIFITFIRGITTTKGVQYINEKIK